MSNIIACPTLWEITVDSMKKLGVSYFSHINKLYQQTTPEHQHAYLDLLAHSKVMLSMKSSEQIWWPERVVRANAPCPPALTLIMRAIACKIPLDVTERQLKYFDGIDHKALQKEVDAQNTWRHNNPYIGEHYYSSTRRFATDNSVFTPTLDNSSKKQFLTMVAATTLTPTSKSILVVDWATKNPRPTFSNPTIYNLEGATEFDHQRALNNPAGTIISSDPYTTIISLAHCPNTVAEKYFTHESFTNED